MKKSVLLTTLITVATLVSCNVTPEPITKCIGEYCLMNVKTIDSDKGSLYGLNGTTKQPTQLSGKNYFLNMYYINGDDEIVYADIEQYLTFCKDFGLPINIKEAEKEDGKLTLKSDNNTIVFDVKNNTITFSDYLATLNETNKVNPLEVSYLASAEDNAKYLKIVEQTYTGSVEEVVHLSDYGLKVYETYDDFEDELQFYLPYAVLNELFFAAANTSCYADYRGVFYIADPYQLKDDNGNLTELGKFMAEIKCDEYSQNFADFNFNTLCLSMDMHYGLGYLNGCEDGFENWVTEKGLVKDLKSTNPKKFSDAMNVVTDKLMNDGHSNFYISSPYCGFADTEYGYGTKVMDLSRQIYSSQYYRYYQVDNLKPYMESGDTAYITFDEFKFDNADCYSWNNKVSNDASSTMQFISYANKQIKRSGSPIKNVVLDMSCNGGGELDSFTFTIAWMLGECKAYVRDPITGAEGYTCYKADVNFDGKYDDKDTVKDLNLYCLEGAGTFSGGNYTACSLKSSGKVTIIGQNSGGGSNCVLRRFTANGAMYQMSGRYEMCTEKDGEYVNTNNGAVPDIQLGYSRIHDRDYLQKNIIK